MKSIGIDIGATSIKIAEVESTSQGYTLKDFVELPLTSDPGVDQRIEIVDHLRRVASLYNPNDTRYVFAIPQERISVRAMTFPFRERHKVVSSLQFELEEDIPFNSEDGIFDAKVLRTHGNTTDVLAIAAPKKAIQDVMQLAHDAGIDPDIITVDAAAMANLFESWLLPPRDIPGPHADLATEAKSIVMDEETQACQIIAHIGHRRTLIAVFYRSTLLITRTVSHGAHSAVESLRRAYQLPYQEALKGVQEKGFVLTSHDGATKDQIEFSDLIVQSLKPLVDELKITLLELKSQFKVEFNQVYLTGGMSQLMNLAAYMTQQLEIPCNLLKITDRITKIAAPVTKTLEVASLPAIGIAIEGLKKPRNPAINLRKLDFGKQSQSLKLFWEKWSGAIKIASAALVVLYIYSFTRDTFSMNLETSARSALSEAAKQPPFNLKGRNASESKVRAFIRDKRKEIEDKKKLSELQGLNSALDIIADISSKVPSKNQISLDVSRLIIKNEVVTLEGQVSQRPHIDLIKNTLRTYTTDGQIKDLNPSGAGASGKIAFAISFKTNRR